MPCQHWMRRQAPLFYVADNMDINLPSVCDLDVWQCCSWDCACLQNLACHQLQCCSFTRQCQHESSVFHMQRRLTRMRCASGRV